MFKRQIIYHVLALWTTTRTHILREYLREKENLRVFFNKKCRKISWHCPFNRSSFLSSSDYKDDDLENDGINKDIDDIDDDCTDI